MRTSWSWLSCPKIISGEPLIMGVLNVTPDSFSDGGLHLSVDQAVSHASVLISEGADIIDVGGESSRPGALPVSVDVERERVIPVIKAIKSIHPNVMISVDTMKSIIAEQAINAGACIINDISGFRDPNMIELAARTKVGVVVMHMRGIPTTMQSGDLSTNDIVSEVCDWLSDRCQALKTAGVSSDSISIDPGIGFGKTLEQNLSLIRGIPLIKERLGYSILIGTSRKSFIGLLTKQPVDQGLSGALASSFYSLQQGASICRVHDVASLRDYLTVWKALEDQNP